MPMELPPPRPRFFSTDERRQTPPRAMGGGARRRRLFLSPSLPASLFAAEEASSPGPQPPTTTTPPLRPIAITTTHSSNTKGSSSAAEDWSQYPSDPLSSFSEFTVPLEGTPSPLRRWRRGSRMGPGNDISGAASPSHGRELSVSAVTLTAPPLLAPRESIIGTSAAAVPAHVLQHGMAEGAAVSELHPLHPARRHQLVAVLPSIAARRPTREIPLPPALPSIISTPQGPPPAPTMWLPSMARVMDGGGGGRIIPATIAATSCGVVDLVDVNAPHEPSPRTCFHHHHPSPPATRRPSLLISTGGGGDELTGGRRRSMFSDYDSLAAAAAGGSFSSPVGSYRLPASWTTREPPSSFPYLTFNSIPRGEGGTSTTTAGEGRCPSPNAGAAGEESSMAPWHTSFKSFTYIEALLAKERDAIDQSTALLYSASQPPVADGVATSLQQGMKDEGLALFGAGGRSNAEAIAAGSGSDTIRPGQTSRELPSLEEVLSRGSAEMERLRQNLSIDSGRVGSTYSLVSSLAHHSRQPPDEFSLLQEGSSELYV